MRWILFLHVYICSVKQISFHRGKYTNGSFHLLGERPLVLLLHFTLLLIIFLLYFLGGQVFFLIRVIEIFCSWPNWQSKIMTLDYPLPEYSLNLHSYALCNGNNCYCYSSKTISDRHWTFTNVSRLIYSRWKISWPPPAVIYSPWMV